MFLLLWDSCVKGHHVYSSGAFFYCKIKAANPHMATGHVPESQAAVFVSDITGHWPGMVEALQNWSGHKNSTHTSHIDN